MKQNAENAHRFYAALAQGDFDTVGALLSDDLVWHQPGQGALSGGYRGKQSVFAHLGRMDQQSHGTFAIFSKGSTRRIAIQWPRLCNASETYQGYRRMIFLLTE